MHPVPLGAKGTFALVVEKRHLASEIKDPALPPVFATPMMVLVMENAALDAVRAYLEPGESCVGTLVSVQHIAATPAGHRVRAEAEVTFVEGSRIGFTVTASDEIEEIGRGTHERRVVDLDRVGSRLASKRTAPRPAAKA
jgi:fluoroacetyl-CoA thioesterase